MDYIFISMEVLSAAGQSLRSTNIKKRVEQTPVITPLE